MSLLGSVPRVQQVAHQPSLMMLHAHLAGSGLARTDSLKTSETDVATLVEVFKIEAGGQRLRF